MLALLFTELMRFAVCISMINLMEGIIPEYDRKGKVRDVLLLRDCP